tara:strand:+ start:2600 stop:3103 length:504 start_codon:yes stop_codon:yes gene_type:complete
MLRNSCFIRCFGKRNYSNKTIPININPKDIKTFIPEIKEGRVIKCYDGDTITVAAYLPFKESELYKFSVRINGIDCPEIRSKIETEKQCAIIAKKTVENKLLNNMIKLDNVKTEKYGRILADIFLKDEPNISIGTWLIEQKLAVNYDGKKKISPDNWLEYYNNNANL